MPIHKNSFQPKDARAISNPYQDEDELDDLLPTRKTMTGTQALVEFLKTTSPEDFPSRPERLQSTNIFSRMRKTKRVNSTHSAPAVGNKKPEAKLDSRAPSFDTPLLPNKKRESSHYSASLRHSLSIKSQTGRRVIPENVKLTKVATDHFVQSAEGNDGIETALLQRLEHMRILEHPMPSDQVAASLAAEHIRALGITHLLEQQTTLDNEPREKRKKTRHMQVQTIDLGPQPMTPTPSVLPQPIDPDDASRARRAEIALEEALDHFEVISGLAYKKLREIWEEKMRWENACLELRERVLALEQGKKYEDSFLLEEDEDDQGLSEFPVQ